MELDDCFWLTCVAGFWLIASQKKKVCGNYWKLWTSVIQRIFTSVCKPWGTATWVMSGDTVAGWGWANSLLWLSEVLAALQSPGERQEVWKCSLKVQSTSIGKDTTSFDFCLRFPLEYSSFLAVIPTMLYIRLLVYCFSQFICIFIILLI